MRATGLHLRQTGDRGGELVALFGQCGPFVAGFLDHLRIGLGEKPGVGEAFVDAADFLLGFLDGLGEPIPLRCNVDNIRERQRKRRLVRRARRRI